MWKKMREFTERHIKLLAAVLVVVITGLWLASQFIGELSDWMIKQNLLSVIIIVLLADNLARLVEIKREAALDKIKIHGDDQCASADVTAFLQKTQPKKADLLEYSSCSIGGLLQNLRTANCEIRLLVKHPDTAITEFQKLRVRATLENVVNVTLRDYNKFQIRCYRLPGSLRGRNLDNALVSLGWYTYSSDEVGLYGHDNSIVCARTDNEKGRCLQQMFNRAFEWLWNDKDTVPVEEVIKGPQLSQEEP
jgi:hypothetical protein